MRKPPLKQFPEQLLEQFQEQVLAPVRWYLKQMVKQFLDHDCLSRAGALTYTTLFAVVPMMTVAYAMFSVLPEFESIGDRIQQFVFETFVPASSAVVQDKLVEFSERAQGLTAVGFAVLFATAFLMLVTMEKAFNMIWQVAEPRKGAQRFFLYWTVLTLGPPLIAAGMFVSLYLVSLPLISDLDTFGLGNVLLRFVPLLLTTIGFTVLYYAVPNCRVPLRHAIAGGVLTTAAFEFAKFAFTAVVSNSSMEPIYGTFAAVPLFLSWLYLVWVLILSGAIFVRTLSLTHEEEANHAEPLLIKCARILELLFAAHLRGDSVSDVEIDQAGRLGRVDREQVYESLHAMRVLQPTEDSQWCLGRSLKSVTLWDLYRQFPQGIDQQSVASIRGMNDIVEPLKSLLAFGSNEMSVSLDSLFGRSFRAV